ncbi:MAG: AAA family ATPase [Myxococcota bacterium]
MTRTLLVLLGPPAVGKMTVGRQLETAVGFPLFHNHMTIEVVLPMFPFGTPPFSRLVNSFRAQVFDEVSKSDLPGFTFTYTCAFDQPEEINYLATIHDRFSSQGWRVCFVELRADQKTRLRRNSLPDRIQAKPSKRDLLFARRNLLEMDEQYTLNSTDTLPFGEHIIVDNQQTTADQAATLIVDRLGLTRIAPLTP